MKFRTPFAVVVLTLLSCAGSAVAQDDLNQSQPNPPAAPYTFKAYNYPGSSSSAAYGISNSGEVVGYYTGAGCTNQASCAFNDIKGKYNSVECALENATDFFDISLNTAEVVGSFSYYGGVAGFTWGGDDLCNFVPDPENAAYFEVWGVNDRGEVVGWYLDSSNAYQGFTSTAKNPDSTLTCFGDPTRAYGINDAGEIVGDYENSSGVFEGFLYKGGKCTTIDFPGSTATYARGINKNGEIAGFYGDENNVAHGFVLNGSKYTTVDYPNAATTFLFHLNNAGQIAGFYQAVAGGANAGLVATPKKAGTTGAGGDAKTKPYTITSFTPASGPAGTTVTIYGSGDLTQTYWLKFNGDYSDGIKVISNTEVTATVPSGATSGRITITLTDPQGAVLTSPTNFTVTP